MLKRSITVTAIIIVNFLISIPIMISYKDVIFDEYWYVPAARKFINNRSYDRPEHPPLAQLLIAMSMLILGDQPLGWRSFSLIFGMISLISLYILTKKTSGDENIALTVITVMSVEKMFFTFSALAVLDIYFISFLLISLVAFLEGKFFLSSILLALSINCKLIALFGIPVFIIIYLYHKKNNSKNRIFFWLLATILFFFVFLEIFDRLFLTDFKGPMISFQHFKYMITVHTSKNWDSTIGDSPWTWLISPRNYYLGDVSLISVKALESSNPLIIGLGIVTLPYSIIRFKRNKGLNDIIILTWTIFFYLSWFLIKFIFSRPIFSFYVLPTIPMICFSNTLFLEKDDHRIFYTLINIGIFVLFQYPFRIFNII